MPTWFDDSRLDDPTALGARDHALRHLAEAGARVRREATAVAEALAVAAVRHPEQARPRAVIAAGPDSRLLRAVLEPWCPVPFVAWPGPGLPGWAGSMDLVVMLAPEGSDAGSASAVAEAVRRGCRVVVACPDRSLVAEHAAGRDSVVLPSTTGDQLATAVVVLAHLHAVGLGPPADTEEVAGALDQVAIDCSPHRDLASNPAKELAIALADDTPLVWGGSVLAARAARRVAEALRRASGRTALAGEVEQLLPVLEAARARDVFADPFADGPADERPAEPPPALLVLDDGADDPVVREQRGRLRAAAAARDLRVETLTCETGCGIARYASLLHHGRYVAEYLRIGLVDETGDAW